MSTNWIRIRDDLHEDPAVLSIAAKLQTRPEHVVGYLYRFWGWVSRNVSQESRDMCPENVPEMSQQIRDKCPDKTGQVSRLCPAGSVTGVPLLSVEAVLNLPGFLTLLIEVGWLEYQESAECSGGGPLIVIPKFDRYLSDSAKTRAIEAERKAKQRRMSPKSVDARPGSVPKMSQKNWDTCPKNVPENLGPEKRREEKIREYKEEGATASPSPSSSKKQKFNPLETDLPFQGKSFGDAWASWCRHRVEIAKPMKAEATRQLLQRLADMGEQRAIEAIRHSVSNGWQGIREPDAPNGRRPSTVLPDFSNF